MRTVLVLLSAIAIAVPVAAWAADAASGPLTRPDTAKTATRSAMTETRSLDLRKLGATGVSIGLPEGWTLRANGGGFFLDDEQRESRVVVHRDLTVGGRFDRLPRRGSPDLAPGASVTEKVLETGARYYRRVEPSGEVAIFVDLALGDGRSMLAAAFGTYEDVCLTLQRSR